MKKTIIGASAFIVLLMAGLFVPLGSYTTRDGCQLENTPTRRLNLIKGDSLREVKDRPEPPEEAGCAINTKYVLYFF